MKYLIVLFLLVMAASAQRVPQGRPKQEIILAQPQVAKDVTVHLTAEVATAWESWRLSMPGITDPVTGMRGPLYPSVKEMISAVLSAPNGMFDRLLTQFPPPSIKAKQDTLEQAQKDADAAREKARGVARK